MSNLSKEDHVASDVKLVYVISVTPTTTAVSVDDDGVHPIDKPPQYEDIPSKIGNGCANHANGDAPKMDAEMNLI